jgi:hypothetical protein
MSWVVTLASACFHFSSQEGAPGTRSAGAKLVPPSILWMPWQSVQ